MTEQGVRVLETIAAHDSSVKFDIQSHLVGGCAIDSTGDPLPKESLQACKDSDAILLGAFNFARLLTLRF